MDNNTDILLNAEKANRLFWLGRYVERGYLTLHLVRRAYDEVIDAPVGAMPESALLDLLRSYSGAALTTSRDMMAYVYNAVNPASLCAVMEMAKSNSMLLRSEICSESLSYIEMSHALLTQCAAASDTNITALQPVTDWLLAFWGSVSERVHGAPLTLLRAGRLVEHIDMNLRFRYKHYRIAEAWEQLRELATTAPTLFDAVQTWRVDALVADSAHYGDEEHQDQLLAALNILVLV